MPELHAVTASPIPSPDAERLRAEEALLVAKAQQGDSRAFDLLVRRYQHRVAALVTRFLRDPEEALDVTQEAFVKAWKALPRFRGDSAFYTWLYRIAVNLAKNVLEQRTRRPLLMANAPSADNDDLPDLEPSHIDTPEHVALRDELHASVIQAMRELPDELRTALQLRELQGMSYEEIAIEMNCPIGTVRSRIFRAREAVDRVVQPFMRS